MGKEIIEKLEEITGLLGFIDYFEELGVEPSPKISAQVAKAKDYLVEVVDKLDSILEKSAEDKIAKTLKETTNDDLVEAHKEKVFEKLKDSDSEWLGKLKSEVDNRQKLAKRESKPTESPTEVLVDNLIDDLPFTEEQKEYKLRFADALKDAIDKMKSSRGYSKFKVQAGDSILSGELSNLNGTITVTVEGDGLEITHSLTTKEEEELNDNSDKDCYCGYELCDDTCEEYKDEENTSNLTGLIDCVEDLDEAYYTKVNEILEHIEEELHDKTTLGPSELRLVQYYFKHQPYNSEDIDSLSDRALELAWRFRNYGK